MWSDDLLVADLQHTLKNVAQAPSKCCHPAGVGTEISKAPSTGQLLIVMRKHGVRLVNSMNMNQLSHFIWSNMNPLFRSSAETKAKMCKRTLLGPHMEVLLKKHCRKCQTNVKNVSIPGKQTSLSLSWWKWLCVIYFPPDSLGKDVILRSLPLAN